MFRLVNFEKSKYVDLKPFNIGRQDCEPGHSYGPAIRNNYLVHYCLSGCGRLYSPYGEYKVREGELFLIKPNEENTYIADMDNPWEYIWIEFNGNAAKKLDVIENPVVKCEPTVFLNIWNSAEKERFREEHLISNLFLLLPMIFENSMLESISNKIKNYIRFNYMHEIKIELLAKNLGYSRQHIAREFKKENGMSVQEFLIKTRLNVSKQILERGFSVSETAEMCGYNDGFNFSKAFKAQFGISPLKWKHKI